jgi:tight adherence protein B
MDPILIIIWISGVALMLALVYGAYYLRSRRKVKVSQRVETYTGLEEEAARAAAAESGQQMRVTSWFSALLSHGYMERLQERLAQADVPMRASEIILLRFVLAGIGFLLGSYAFGNMHSGVILAVLGFFTPVIYLTVRHGRRQAKFVRQLADALMLLTNSLRAGYGFLKGLELVAKEMDDPIAKELKRLLREVNLGATIEQALVNMGRRLNCTDLDIVISAYLIQKDVGGNLTEVTEKVAETIRERLRLQGDIRVLTAQGRFSGYVVGLLPFALIVLIWMQKPDYFSVMLGEPKVLFFWREVPLGLLILIGAGLWQIVGWYWIYKTVSIKV